MNETEHLFPLPEFERHKLDAVREEVVHPMAHRMRRTLNENVWTAVALAVAAGLVCGWAWGRRG